MNATLLTYGETLGIIAYEMGIENLLSDAKMTEELKGVKPGEKTELILGWKRGWQKALLAAPLE